MVLIVLIAMDRAFAANASPLGVYFANGEYMIILKIVLVVLLLILLYNLIDAMMTTRALMEMKKIQLQKIMWEWKDLSRRSEAEYQAMFHPESTPNKACSRRVPRRSAKVVKSKSNVSVGRTRG